MLNSELCWMDGWMDDTWKRINLTNFFKLLSTARANRRSYLHFSLLLENGTENQVKLVRKAGHTTDSKTHLTSLFWNGFGLHWGTHRVLVLGVLNNPQTPTAHIKPNASLEKDFSKELDVGISKRGEKKQTPTYWVKFLHCGVSFKLIMLQ